MFTFRKDIQQTAKQKKKKGKEKPKNIYIYMEDI